MVQDLELLPCFSGHVHGLLSCVLPFFSLQMYNFCQKYDKNHPDHDRIIIKIMIKNTIIPVGSWLYFAHHLYP